MSSQKTHIVMIGGGGHAKVLSDALDEIGRPVVAVCCLPTDAAQAKAVSSNILDDEALAKLGSSEILLVNGIGSVASTDLRRRIYTQWTDAGFEFMSVVHPSAIMSKRALLGRAIQVMAGAVVQTGAKIGDDVIINTRSSIDHDSTIGAHSHIAPGCTISGGVTVGQGVHIGTGAAIRQGIKIGDGAVIGVGARVFKDVPAGAVVVGDGRILQSPRS